MDYIKELFASPEMTALISAAISYLSANLLTLILFAIKYVKLKKVEMSGKADNQKIIEALTAEFQAKLTLINSNIDKKLANLEIAVCDKLADLDAAEKAKIEAETVTLEQTISEVKQSLNITDVDV